MTKVQTGGRPHQSKKTDRLVPPGPMVQAKRSNAFAPIEGKAWEIAVRELTEPQDWLAMAGELAQHMGPGNLHNFVNFGLDLSVTPTPSPRVSMVREQLRADEDSTAVEIGSAGNWCQNQYVAANLQSKEWADRVLDCPPGEGAALAAAERDLVLAIVAFKGEMQRAYGDTGYGLLAAVVARVLIDGDSDDRVRAFQASMQRSHRIDKQLAKEAA